jgi:hypothetical protein
MELVEGETLADRSAPAMMDVPNMPSLATDAFWSISSLKR